MYESLNDILDIQKGDVIAIIGSGGKTSLAYNIALQNTQNKFILTTTTKMLDASKDLANCHNFYDLNEKPKIGINLYGKKIKNGKISSLSDKDLSELIKLSSIFVYEADGSKGLLLKAWNDNEPVILKESNKCIGVLPFCLGEKISKELIHRYELFLNEFNVKENEIITKELLNKIALKMFSKIDKNIKKYIFFNRVSDFIALKEVAKNLNDFIVFTGSSIANTYERIQL